MEKIEMIIKELQRAKIKAVKCNEPLAPYTSFKIGGSAKLMVCPKTVKQICDTVTILKIQKAKWFLLGNCTNVLVRDEGVDGVVVKLGKPFNRYRLKGNTLTVEAGMSLFELNRLCAELQLSGLEWSYGIPGSLGGAVRMNSGAFGHSMSEVVQSVYVFDGEKKRWLTCEEMKFSYRKSIICFQPWIILKAKLELNLSTKEKITEEQNIAIGKKKATQPYSDYSAGSVFKRYNDLPVSKLIDELGLKGYRIGGAEISKIHAGFIVNKGQASCQDVLNLVKYIQEKLQQTYGFTPELEIELIGDTNDTVRRLSHPHDIQQT